jgi:hypothetical protein
MTKFAMQNRRIALTPVLRLKPVGFQWAALLLQKLECYSLQSVRHKISLFSLWQHHKSNAAGSKHMLYPKTLDTNQAKVY